MMIQVVCEDCHTTTPLAAYLNEDDLKGTPFEHLLNNHKFKVYDWQNQMIKENRGEYRDGFFWCDGIKIMDEYDRYMETNACPNCGSTNTHWY